MTSFKKYLEKLHPINQSLWQRPRKQFCDSDKVWYDNAALGKNILGSFMSNLSDEADLSKRIQESLHQSNQHCKIGPHS